MGQQGQGLAVNPETPEKWLHADHMTQDPESKKPGEPG
jgi:hypothetical protein